MKLAFIVILMMSVSISAFAADEAQTGQHPRKFEKQITIKLDYLLYLPPDYEKDAQKQWPLIVFLHGSGESANGKPDVDLVAKWGPPNLLKAGTDLPLKNFIVVSPQCPSSRMGWRPDMLNPFLDEILAKYRVDADRVYLTGLSMGGYGTWTWAMQNPGRFAAIAPMSGGGNPDPRRVKRAFSHMPIWDFHGGKDPVVPVSESEAMIDAVKKTGNTDVKFTVYPDLQHNCWQQAYGNAELYDWFLQHKRQPAPQRRR